MNHKTKLQFTLLILAAEIMYALPFVLIRIFRTTLSNAFNINNHHIGTCFTLYGITSLISYLIGGFIADKFQPKYLMSIALFLTGIGGFIWVYYPSIETLYLLYVYWGVTTIMLFWSPLIKAVRIIGAKKNQVTAFTILEGGRGIVASIIGIIGLLIISIVIPKENSSQLQLQKMMNLVYLMTSILIIFIAFLILLLPNIGKNSQIITQNNFKDNILKVFKYPVVWILMIIIFTSYLGYKITAVFTQYVSEFYGYSTKESTILATIFLLLRFFVCVLILIFARKLNPAKLMVISFFIMAFGSLLLIFNHHFLKLSLILSISIPALGVYALRALYFTIIDTTKVPIQITGTLIGVVSVIGYSPELFIGKIEGLFLEESSGINGFEYLFILLFITSVIGLTCSVFFYNSTRNKNNILSS